MKLLAKMDWKSVRFFSFVVCTIILSVSGVGRAQRIVNIAKPQPLPPGPDPGKLFHPAPVEEHTIYSLDLARTVKLMSATPDGSHWYVVDEFANWQTITIDGHPFSKQFHEISAAATRLSPNGNYLIWTGLLRAFTHEGFDSTTAYVYKDTSLVGNFISDYPVVEFSRTGRQWAELLPYAYETQKGDRDFVIVDGKVVHKNEVYPHQFSFSHDEDHWAYRATDGLTEKLVTDASDTSIVLYKRPIPQKNFIWDPTVWRYTSDVQYRNVIEGRDYDFDFVHVAKKLRTAYSSRSADTVRTYINYDGYNQGLYRWINEIHMDDSGRHIAYFAADPAISRVTDSSDEHRAVVVYDGKVVAGPYPGVSNLFLSSSGKHYAYTLSPDCAFCGTAGIPKFYIDRKLAYRTNKVINCVWSPDESKTALVIVGEHGKLFVAAGGKRSPLFEQIGQVAWTPDGRHVEFVGVSNGKVIVVKQAL
ncbi:MAG TPA: hypothetical protein VG537_05970 [Candidatus Kapabacteria bacterium]|jgi:hypothetical protein|nr:hypothetical protein [Candidatus Kapabacteria bacterium]